jgi:hypothetical protein
MVTVELGLAVELCVIVGVLVAVLSEVLVAVGVTE